MNEPAARWSDRKRYGKAVDKAYWDAVSRARQAKKAAKRAARNAQRKPKNKRHQPPECFSFFPHTDAARKYARKYRGLTKAEWEVWSRLRSDIHHKWHKQVPCGSYILDFYCHETRTVVEIDGPEHYTKEGLAHDAQRTSFLKHRHKLRVFRYKNDDAYLDGDILAAQIIRDNLTADDAHSARERERIQSLPKPRNPKESAALFAQVRERYGV